MGNLHKVNLNGECINPTPDVLNLITKGLTQDFRSKVFVQLPTKNFHSFIMGKESFSHTSNRINSDFSKRHVN